MNAPIHDTQITTALLQRLHEREVRPTGVSEDSRRLRRGELFLSYANDPTQRNAHIIDAVSRGACAVLWQAGDGFAGPEESIRVPDLPVEDLRKHAGPIAHEILRHPSENLSLIAVTGTNGKTSLAHWIAGAYPNRRDPRKPPARQPSRCCASVGTLGAGFPGELLSTGFTTPEAPHLASLLSDFGGQGAHACVLEASSIGIAEGRLNGAHVEVAVFTNLGRDHLDYHGDMEHYANAKKQLFLRPELRRAIINLDDAFGQHLWEACTAQTRTGYSISGATLPDNLGRASSSAISLLSADHICADGHRQLFSLRDNKHAVDVATPLVGYYNIQNLLAVAAVWLDAGLTLPEVAERLSALSAPPGRMERYGVTGEPMVLVDYAHTPDALANALSGLRALTNKRQGRLVCVFGCGGDRDVGKRPLMGNIANRLADLVWLTSDNPRGEDPEVIIDAMAAGAPDAHRESDRRRAIINAIAEADASDVILVAGKGHEDYQEAGGRRSHFSDREVVKAALLALRRSVGGKSVERRTAHVH